MRLPTECYQMQQTIQQRLPHLMASQRTGLTLWVYGAIAAGSACQNAVIAAIWSAGKRESLRQYLREWLYDGSDRARLTSAQLDVSACFGPLLKWTLNLWQSERLALAIDPTLKVASMSLRRWSGTGSRS